MNHQASVDRALCW